MFANLTAFMDACGSITTGDVVRHLMQVAFASPRVAHSLWSTLFPAAWQSVSDRERAVLLPHVASLLVRDYHQHQLLANPAGGLGTHPGLACLPAWGSHDDTHGADADLRNTAPDCPLVVIVTLSAVAAQ